jgi:hypothetical protein
MRVLKVETFLKSSLVKLASCLSVVHSPLVQALVRWLKGARKQQTEQFHSFVEKT